MADNVAITAGTGTTVSTEEVTTLNGGTVSAQHLQRTATAFRTADGVASDAATGAGTVAAGVQRVTLASDDPAVAAIQAGTVGVGTKGAPHANVLSTQFPVTAKFANIAASSSGDTNLVADVTSKKIRVLALSLMGNGAVNAAFQDRATTTQRGGMVYMAAAGQGKVLPFNPVGWFETASGVGLDINLSASVAVGGELVYEEV